MFAESVAVLRIALPFSSRSYWSTTPVAAVHDKVYEPVALFAGPAIGPGAPGTQVSVPTHAVFTSQWSPAVHASESLHEVPDGFAGFEQTPVDGAQVPALWH